MASEQQTPAGSSHTAQVVGNAFVHQYYHILHQSPELVHRFYQDISKLGRPEENGNMSSVTTMQAINEKILSLDYGEYRAELKTVDAQESFNGGVTVLVTGYLTGKDNVSRNFTQSFFLAPQDKGYFVLNDIFRYMEDVSHPDGKQGFGDDVQAPVTPDQDPSPLQDNKFTEETAVVTEEVNELEEYNPSENSEGSVVEEEVPVAEVVDETPNDSQVVSESNSKIEEEAPKKTYASIVKVMKESAVPPSTAAAPPPRSLPKNNEAQISNTSPPAPIVETPISCSTTTENGNSQEGEADGYSIYIKGLPLNATPAMLEDEFIRFGPIKSGGIQVRSNRQQGFCFGFVEFEVASAVQSALEASPIIIGGRQAHVEEKKSSNSRGNNRGRFPPGRGVGFRNEGARGRGNYGGGRSYSRGGDFNNRNDFGSNRGRGGFSNRGGDGYQRGADNMGTGSARINRGPASAATKTMAPRVSASA